MELVPFSESDAAQLCAWIPNEKANFQWGGPTFSFPLTPEQICEHIAREEVKPYLLTHDKEPIGYIELFRVSDSEYRLCRVLVASPAHRGKGWGYRLVELALEQARMISKVYKVSLAVFAHNTAAIACYSSLGFVVLPELTKTRFFNGETWTLLRMERWL
ncbi:GNAT family N-acetyltransferase [Enterovibrio makurazakiensis]|uniref:GNAT family N-acetyltransferase n=1 Tax=Enterovibrio gelatinilyticus TaxID=2899819 RepID=A0ABT5R086_9GAMM|nr:GNAT family N-acetyltransferase [Enterovibrio sp. ZSDZ42]MDD1793682.1 GNAT family N-acetyltransferase [Enterovibrio sp. ZSDZ42]